MKCKERKSCCRGNLLIVVYERIVVYKNTYSPCKNDLDRQERLLGMSCNEVCQRKFS